MKIDDEKEWDADDATWKLLGKAAPRRASARFADDALRRVNLLPEANSWWPKVISFSPWIGLAACGLLTAILMIHSAEEDAVRDSSLVAVSVSAEEKWGAIAEVADTEMLAAAAEDLDSFSDQELVSLVGF